ncbi:MAG TPA: hypothetical protein PKW83_16680 [Verrucomicrobiota bacterium]|nr:hypothetical protein [Verrucomicrobiota bacterium]
MKITVQVTLDGRVLIWHGAACIELDADGLRALLGMLRRAIENRQAYIP